MPRATRDTPERLWVFAYGAVTLYGPPFQVVLLTLRLPFIGVPLPQGELTSPWFSLFPFRSPLLRESLSFSFPPLTEMFHFSGCRLTGLCIHPVIVPLSRHWVSPFGDPRITACRRLPEAYRSLPRPSSPPGAKASTMRP